VIVSHKHKLIFLKTKKTAGTALELAMATICGPEDIITPTDPDEGVDALRRVRLPQNYERRGLNTWPTRLFERFIRRGKRDRTDFYHHISADRLKVYVGQKVWQTYTKFTIERNPWDRELSYYYYMRERKSALHGVSFSDFIRSRAGNMHNSRIYTIGQKLAVDDVLRFELLDEDWSRFLERRGLPFVPLSRANTNARRPRVPYQQSYNECDRNHIAGLYKTEIDLFGYDFETGMPRCLPMR
jgi:Sulfotransferase family